MTKIMINTDNDNNVETKTDSGSNIESNTEPITEPEATPAVELNKLEDIQSALASGLPTSWSIEPPAVVVRRKARSL